MTTADQGSELTQQKAELRLETWAIRVDKILDWQGRTRQWLAARLDMDVAQFHRLMHGQKGATLYPKHKKAIAEWLSVHPGVIFDEEIAGVLLRLTEIGKLLSRMETALDRELSDVSVNDYRDRMRSFVATYKWEVDEEKQQLAGAEARRLDAVAASVEVS